MKKEKFPPLYLRSVAFNKMHIPYLLIRQRKNIYVTKLDKNNSLKIIREIPNKFWFFDIIQSEEGKELGLFADDYPQEYTAYSLSSNERGKKISKDLAYNSHWVVSTCNCRPYFVINRYIYTYAKNKIVNLDKNPNERLQEELDATFFIFSEKGLYRHCFLDSPTEWELFYKSDKGDCKQLVYDPLHNLVVSITNIYGYGWVHFIDMNGKAQTYSDENGFWSVANFQSRFFFYTWGNIIELTKGGQKHIHNIDGTIARNQCLFSTPDTLYFVCENEIHIYSDNKWSKIDIAGQSLIL